MKLLHPQLRPQLRPHLSLPCNLLLPQHSMHVTTEPTAVIREKVVSASNVSEVHGPARVTSAEAMCVLKDAVIPMLGISVFSRQLPQQV